MFELFLGHLCGDYLLQTKFMALNKAKNSTKGWIAAILHCIIYTASVCFFMWNFDIIWVVMVFLSHFFIDKFALGEWWLKNVKGNSLKEYVDKREGAMKRSVALEGGFMAFIYVATDNSMHLILMWLSYNLIY